MFSVTELIQVSRSECPGRPGGGLGGWGSGEGSGGLGAPGGSGSPPDLCPPAPAPVVTGAGPNFSLGELQGHLAYDLNPAGAGMRRTLPSTSSSG